MITHKRVYVKRFCKFFCNFLTPWRGTQRRGGQCPPAGRWGADPYDNKSRTAAIPSSVKHTPPLALAVPAVT